MQNKDDEIKSLKRQIKILQKKISYYESGLFHFDVCNEIVGHYSMILQPPLKDLHTTIRQKASEFKINILDIICIISARKTKWIYFKNIQKSISGESLKSDKLSFTGSIAKICQKFDSSQVHLLKISNSVVVNLAYYVLESNRLKLNLDKNPHGKCDNLTISPSFIDDFVIKKSQLESLKAKLEALISFQKNAFGVK
jgi:hypothetical protein